MGEIVFWLLVAFSTAFTGMLLAKYVGRLGALAIMLVALLAAWITGFSVEGFFESVSEMFLRLGHTLITFLLS